jgi:Mce-associated membrane protein
MSQPTPPPSRRKIAGERTRRTPGEPSLPLAPPPPPPAHHGEGDDGDHDSGAEPTGTGGVARIPSWLLIGLAVLLAAAAIFDVIFAFRAHNRTEQADTRSAAITSAFSTAPAQAEKAAVRILGYDYKTLESDADEARSFMTPEYADTFQNTVDALLKAPANQVKAHVEAKVMTSGVASATPSKVEVLLFIDQVSTTTANADPQTALNRVVLTMVEQGDRWLVDDITAL